MRAQVGTPRRVAGTSKGRNRDVVHPEVIRVGIALLVVHVREDDVWTCGPDDLHELRDRIVERDVRERLGVLVVRRFGHARVPVAQQHDLREPDCLGRVGELVPTYSRQIGLDLCALPSPG